MEKIYKYPNPGFQLPLWLDGKEIKTSKGKSNALFRDTGNGPDRCGIYRTTEEDVQKAVEQSNAFKKGVIVKIASDDEIRFLSAEAEKKKFRADVVELAYNGIITPENIRIKKAAELNDFAKKMGIPTTTDKANRLKEEVLTDVLEQLFPGLLEEEAAEAEAEEPVEVVEKPKGRPSKKVVKEDLK